MPEPKIPVGLGSSFSIAKGSRLYPHIFSICASLDAFSIAAIYMTGAGNPTRYGQYQGMMCWQFDLWVLAPLMLAFPSAMNIGEPPDKITFHTLIDTKPKVISDTALVNLPDKKIAEIKSGAGLFVENPAAKPLSSRTIEAEFFLFFEDNYRAVKRYASHDISKLPPKWAFGRIVRNAIVHGGVVSIDDKTFTPVPWYGLTIGPDQNGHELLLKSVFLGDLLILLVEMEAELTSLGL